MQRSLPPVGLLRRTRRASDVPKYNEIAAQVMTENGVPLDDLYTLILPRQAELQIKGNVQFKTEGYKAVAGQASAAIEKALAKW